MPSELGERRAAASQVATLWGRRYGEHLEAARTRALLSRAQLAGRLGVSEESVRRWERGGARPSPEVLARMIVILSLDAAQFISLPNRANDLPTLARELREERYQRAISQAQAGKVLGVAQATYAGWEIGRSLPAGHHVSAIAQFLGVSDERVEVMAASPFVVDTTHWPPLGRVIGGRREDLRMTREELARELGVSQATVAAWELGYRLPRPQQLAQLAGAIDVALDTLEGALPIGGNGLSALGELILSRQRRLGLRAQDIARRAHVDEATISRWANGHHRPTVAGLERLSTALEVPFDEVWRASGFEAAN